MFMLLLVSLSISYVNGAQQSIEKLGSTSRQSDKPVPFGKSGKAGKEVDDEFDQMVQSATAKFGSHRGLKLIEKCTICMYFS